MYRAWALHVDSNIPLPELPRAGGAAPAVRFVRLADDPAWPAPQAWLHELRIEPDDPPWLSYGRLGAAFLLRFWGLADFLVRDGGCQVHCGAPPETPDDTIRHLFIDQVLPLVLSLRGRTVLHAAAVVTAGEEAIALLGDRGAGKSTLAATLCLAGCRLVTDDALLVEEGAGTVTAIPGYPGVRLWPDALPGIGVEGLAGADVAHYTDKRRVGLGADGLRFCDRPARLRRAFLLDPVDEPGSASTSREPLSRRDALIALLRHSLRLEVSERRAISAEFARLERVARMLPIDRVRFPRGFARLTGVGAALLDLLRRSG